MYCLSQCSVVCNIIVWRNNSIRCKWPCQVALAIIGYLYPKIKNVFFLGCCHLTHWGRVTHICVSKLTIIGSDNGLSPGRHQAIIWTNAEILLIGPWGTNFSEILIGTDTFSFKKIHLKMSSEKWRPFCLGLNVLRYLLQSLDPNPFKLDDTPCQSPPSLRGVRWVAITLLQMGCATSQAVSSKPSV